MQSSMHPRAAQPLSFNISLHAQMQVVDTHLGAAWSRRKGLQPNAIVNTPWRNSITWSWNKTPSPLCLNVRLLNHSVSIQESSTTQSWNSSTTRSRCKTPQLLGLNAKFLSQMWVDDRIWATQLLVHAQRLAWLSASPVHISRTSLTLNTQLGLISLSSITSRPSLICLMSNLIKWIFHLRLVE